MTSIHRKMEIVKNIVLIAHDNRKEDLLEWVTYNKGTLSKHHLSATGTTGKLIQERLSLPVFRFISGPLGGDQQIGSKIVEDGIDFMVFFWDPLSAQPHDPDVKALLRIAVLYNIPMACNRSSADFLISSPLMEKEYNRILIDYGSRITTKN
ncbi:methylglyoxal synthase [Leptospira sp. 96542]|nr:methylglyoxal synthase [Leptospira sp. 96542]